MFNNGYNGKGLLRTLQEVLRFYGISYMIIMTFAKVIRVVFGWFGVNTT